MTLGQIADELGGLRGHMKSLKLRESELRGAILQARPNAPVKGRDYEVTLRHGTSRRIDKSRLPEAILSDPRYWKTTRTTTVTSRLAKTDPAPARGMAGTVPHPGEDLQVIEDW